MEEGRRKQRRRKPESVRQVVRNDAGAGRKDLGSTSVLKYGLES